MTFNLKFTQRLQKGTVSKQKEKEQFFGKGKKLDNESETMTLFNLFFI